MFSSRVRTNSWSVDVFQEGTLRTWVFPPKSGASPPSLPPRQCLFLLWCMAPVSWNGSQIIYTKVVRPVFLRHEAMVDDMVNSLGGKAMSAAEHLTREGAPPRGSSRRRPLAAC